MRTTGIVLGVLLLFGLVQSAEPLPAGARLRIAPGYVVSPFGNNSAPALLPPDYAKFVYGDEHIGIRLRDAIDGKWLDESTAPPGGLVVVSPDGSRAATYRNRKWRFWNLKPRSELPALVESDKDAVQEYSGSAPNDTLAVLSRDGSIFARCVVKKLNRTSSVLLWDVAKGAAVTEITLPGRSAPARIALSPDGKMLATWEAVRTTEEDGKVVTTWDVKTGLEKFQFRATGLHLNGVAFSPDGEQLALSTESSIDVVNTRSSKPVVTVHGRLNQGRWMVFSPDKKTLAATGYEGVVERWSLPDGRHLGTSRRTADMGMAVEGMGYTDDGRLLVWGLRDRDAEIWEPAAGKTLTRDRLKSHPVHTQPITSLAFNADGSELVSTDRGGTLFGWNAGTGEL